MKTTCIALLALWAGLTAFSLSSATAQSTDDSTSGVAILKRHAFTPQLAPALEEIVKLNKAGVAEPVMLTFIQTSPTAYSLDAQDVIQLQRQGVSAQIMTALMEHGEEIRRAATESNKSTQTTAPATAPACQTPAPAASAPASAPVVYTAASTYPASTVSVTYFGSPSYAYASGYYGYGGDYYYSGGCYPSYYSYAPRYYGFCAPRSACAVGGFYGGVRYGGFYGGYGRCR